MSALLRRLVAALRWSPIPRPEQVDPQFAKFQRAFRNGWGQ